MELAIQGRPISCLRGIATISYSYAGFYTYSLFEDVELLCGADFYENRMPSFLEDFATPK